MNSSLSSSSSEEGFPQWVGWVAAFAAPAIYAVVNLLDKHVLDKRVNSTEGYLLLVGILASVFSATLALLADWGTATLAGLGWASFSGFVFGVAGLFYYFALGDESASSVVGLEYAYPLVISVLAVVFLHERLTALSGVGIAAVCLGAVLLSVDISISRKCLHSCSQQHQTIIERDTSLSPEPAAATSETAALVEEKKKSKMPAWKFLLLTGCLVCCTAVYEFSYKLATEQALGSIAIAAVCYGVLTVTLVLGAALVVLVVRGRPATVKLFREQFPAEASRNLLWALLNEGLTLSTVLCTIVAMGMLPASVVAPLGAVQPLYVLLVESTLHRDWRSLLRKAFPILLLTAGVVLLGLSDMA